MNVHKKQDGFGIVGILMVVVVMAAIAAAGWFVWQRQNESDKNASNKDDSSQTEKPEAEEPKEDDKYVTIKEWGVQLPYQGPLKITYEIEGNLAKFSTDELTAADPNCKDDAWLTIRYAPNETGILHDDTTAEEAAKRAAASSDPVVRAVWTQVDNYYYYNPGKQAACTRTADDVKIEEKTNELFREITSAMQAVPDL